MTARTPQRQRLLELLGPVITSQGYDMEDVSVSAAGRRSLVRVVVDGDGGIDLDGVAEVSRAIAQVLDDGAGAPDFAGPYVLEVTSPGVDRPLTEARHWRRAVGRLVSVSADSLVLTGRVSHATAAEVVLEIDGRRRRFALDSLGAGHVLIEFARGADGEGTATGGSRSDRAAHSDDDGDDAAGPEDADDVAPFGLDTNHLRR